MDSLIAPLIAVKDAIGFVFNLIGSFVQLVFCVVYTIIFAPLNYLSYILNGFISGIATLFPSTPQGFGFSSLLAGMANAVPFVGGAVVFEIVNGALVLLGIFLVFKAVKYIPFI
jgi:hypothetical protein